MPARHHKYSERKAHKHLYTLEHSDHYADIGSFAGVTPVWMKNLNKYLSVMLWTHGYGPWIWLFEKPVSAADSLTNTIGTNG